jgi:hypothetical protein
MLGAPVPVDVLLLPPEKFNEHVEKTLHFVEGASELVRTAYMCLRLVNDLSRLCQRAHRISLVDFPALDQPIRDLRRDAENLDTHVQIELSRLTQP